MKKTIYAALLLALVFAAPSFAEDKIKVEVSVPLP
jgi:hypothetical protein